MKLSTVAVVLLLIATPVAQAAPPRPRKAPLRYVTLDRMLKQFSREAATKLVAKR